jgi:hypothetical protein
MDKINNIIKEIKQIETEHYNRCSHPTSDKIVCLNLSYQLWQLKVKLQNLKK